ncbi:hypothetical protein AYJ09_01555 [Candidatus Liberibacter solanacearum]|uniref:hypothetical protein n=1 Tax=Candidatus Liberibacter solanacearum TaxID=556287 RepID=UPI000978D6FB|nr:hypothetical protein [Candidatus Liberibacter solanacearum]ONI59094.1 hypothetical protein AYJ09_01555 [Candidatus Liberibacter solanacearum]
MSVQAIEEAVKAKDVAKLCEFLALITNGLKEITQVDLPKPEVITTPQEAVDPDLKKRVTVLALDYMKKHGDAGKSQFLLDILVPALGVHKTFVDCTDEDFRAIELRLLEKSDA